jgi:hypothetical protein
VKLKTFLGGNLRFSESSIYQGNYVSYIVIFPISSRKLSFQLPPVTLFAPNQSSFSLESSFPPDRANTGRSWSAHFSVGLCVGHQGLLEKCDRQDRAFVSILPILITFCSQGENPHLKKHCFCLVSFKYFLKFEIQIYF